MNSTVSTAPNVNIPIPYKSCSALSAPLVASAVGITVAPAIISSDDTTGGDVSLFIMAVFAYWARITHYHRKCHQFNRYIKKNNECALAHSLFFIGLIYLISSFIKKQAAISATILRVVITEG